MPTPEGIAELADLLHCLRAADVRLRVFGSEQHGYCLGPVLSEAELAAFEAAHRIRLPEDYRQFLATVGNGGAGPYYGLEPLGAFGRDLSRPFPFTRATDQLSEEEQGQLPDRDVYPGLLEFCHHGCAIYSYLVVNGASYGTIWDGREDFYPTGLTFAAWYRRWVERSLRSLENERMVRRIRVGMSKAEVVAELGGDWEARPIGPHARKYWLDYAARQCGDAEVSGELLRATRILSSTDLPAEVALDERDKVVKVVPWPFL